MRIAQITYSYQPITGGGDVYVQQLREVVEHAGHQHVVLQRRAGEVGEGVRTFPGVPRLLRGKEYWLLPLFLPLQRGWLRACDVLIVHYPNYLPPVRWHRGTICISHGVNWDDRPRSWAGRAKRRFYESAFRRARAFVANDTNFLREMGLDVKPAERAFEQVAPGKWYIPNCVDAARFREAEPLAELAELAPIVVPRNLYRNRGVHLAIDAFARIAGEHPETHLVVVGATGQAEYGKELEAQVRRLRLEQRVVFWGPVAWAQMPRVYAAARAAVVPSVAGEGTSLAALEAMASGTPTLCTRVGGLPDLPAELCEPEANAVAAEMSRMLEAGEEIGRRQQQAVREGHGLERWEQAWLAVVEQVAASG